jgi:hypothetical protein
LSQNINITIRLSYKTKRHNIKTSHNTVYSLKWCKKGTETASKLLHRSAINPRRIESSTRHFRVICTVDAGANNRGPPSYWQVTTRGQPVGSSRWGPHRGPVGLSTAGGHSGASQSAPSQWGPRHGPVGPIHSQGLPMGPASRPLHQAVLITGQLAFSHPGSWGPVSRLSTRGSSYGPVGPPQPGAALGSS